MNNHFQRPTVSAKRLSEKDILELLHQTGFSFKAIPLLILLFQLRYKNGRL